MSSCRQRAVLPPQMRDLYAVDALHPNDLGQFMMARAIYPVLEKALLREA